MAKKGSFSKVYDKNGDYVDVEAARFDGTRTFQMQGDVTASQTWNGDPSSPLTLNTSIGAKKVTTDKINDKAVQTGQIDDGAVGLTQIATNAMNGTVQDNDSKLATHAAVKTYVDSQISGQGTYLGKHTVAEINAMVTDNLHNGDRVMTSDSGTINLGPGGVGFDVEAGEDLILYKSGSTVQWDSMDGNFKTKQTAVSDPTASGTGLTFIDSASQDENGEMTLSKKTVQDGTTSQKGVVQLEDSHSSTSTTKAATPNSVKEAYDLANTANTGAVKNVAYDSTNKKITKTINGTTTDVVSAATLKTDMALNNVDNTSDANKPVSTAQQAALDLKLDKTGDGKDVTATFTEASTRENIGTGEKLSVIFGKIKKWFSDLGTAAFKNVPASGNASSTEVVLGSDTRLSAGASAVQDVTVDGASVVNSSTKVAAVPNASTSAKGAVQLAGNIGATVASENNKAATEKAVRDAINALDAEVTSSDGTNVQVKVTEADGKISSVNVTTDNTENKNNKVSSWQSTPDNTHYPSEKLVKDGLDAKADASKVLAVADATYTRENETGPGWNKLASIENFGTWRNNIGAFDLYFANLGSITSKATLLVNVRWDSTRTSANILDGKIIWESKNGDFNVAIVNRASSSSVITEIWAYLPKGNYSMALSYRSGSTKTSSTSAHAAMFTDNKDNWSFFSYLATSQEKPTEDLTNYVKVKDADVVVLQKNIASPTNNNLVAMDANGLVKDSGLTKSSVESAISSAGSAIQGVNVNNTTLTPDANKVVTVPLATTSADGAMSAADKTKLDNAVVDKTGFAYRATQGGEVFKIADKTINLAVVHSEQIVFDVSYATHPSAIATSKLELSVRVFENGTMSIGYFINSIIDLRGFLEIPFVFYAYADSTTGILTLYAKRVAGAYVTVEAKCISALYERNNVLNDVSVYKNVSAELPENVTQETTILVAKSASSSGTAPVKVDAYGALTPVPMDSTPTASSTNLMTSGDIKTALDGKQDSFPEVQSTWVQATIGTETNRYRKIGSATLGAWSRATAIFVCSFDDGRPGGILEIALRRESGSAGEPTHASVSLFTTTQHGGNIDATKYNIGYEMVDGTCNLYFKATSTQGQVCRCIYSRNFTVATASVSTAPSAYTNIPIYTGAQSQFETATGSSSVPIYVDKNGVLTACTDDFVHDGDVASTYSSTGTAPVNGTAVASAISTKQDALSFMTTAEAHSLWTNAKANAS